MNNKYLLLGIIVLTIYKILAINFTDFDLFGDEAQYWIWSKELDFGYYSKPPFLSWIIAGYTKIFGESFFYLKLLPLSVYFFTAWGIYSLCTNIGFNKNQSLACSIVFLFIPAVSFSSFIISTDLFLLLFWTLSLNEIVKIKKLPNIKSFFLLGIFLGLGFLSKYAAVYFIFCIIVYILLDLKFRQLFAKNILGFSISFLCVFLILLPNIIWNINNNWVTLSHTSDNTNLNNIEISFYRGLEFLIIQILMIGPILFIGNLLNFKNLKFYENGKMLLVFSIPIFLIVFFEALIVRANANWAAPGLISFYIFLFSGIKNIVLKRLNVIFNFVFGILFFTVIGATYKSNITDRISDIGDFSEYVFSETSSNKIFNLVVSDRLLFANIKYLLRDRGLLFYMPHEDGSEITNHFKMSFPLKKGMNKNFILIGSLEDISYLEKTYIVEKKTTQKYSFSNREISVYEIIFN